MIGVKEMKIKLKKPNVETKCAASPKLALPRNILNKTLDWERNSLATQLKTLLEQKGKFYTVN